MVRAVDLSRLGPLEEVDSGSFGTVYRLSSHTLRGFGHLAYKEYTVAPDSAEVDNLTALVEFRLLLDPRSRAILDDAAAWPLHLVTRRGAVCGFVMQLIPPPFFGEQILPSGRAVQLPVKSQWLVVDPAKADAAGIRVPRAGDLPSRIVMCAKLAHIFGVLHRAGLVYGDLSLNNVIFSAAVPPRVMLVDCDAVQSPAAAPIAQAHTPDWTPPEFVNVPGRQDVTSDRYKLALFILRVLTTRQPDERPVARGRRARPGWQHVDARRPVGRPRGTRVGEGLVRPSDRLPRRFDEPPGAHGGDRRPRCGACGVTGHGAMAGGRRLPGVGYRLRRPQHGV